MLKPNWKIPTHIRLSHRNKPRKCSEITKEIFKKVALTTTVKRKTRKAKRKSELRVPRVKVNRRGDGKRKVDIQSLEATAEEVTVNGDTKKLANVRRKQETEIPPDLHPATRRIIPGEAKIVPSVGPHLQPGGQPPLSLPLIGVLPPLLLDLVPSKTGDLPRMNPWRRENCLRMNWRGREYNC